MTTTTYLTVARAGSAEVEVRRSRFLAHVERVETETRARAVVEAARKEHWDARHHCWASVVGPDAGVQRASDDGEPSGTAGAPMLEVLRGRDLSDVVVVVTRWFGGTLLGAGGLVRAYSDAVRAVLDEVGVRPRVLMSRFDLAAGHAEAARWEADLRSRGVTVLGVDHAEHATLHLAVPAEEVDVLTARVASLTAGSAGLAPVGDTWVDGSVA
jgi:uncharacterized YigZ family protein